MQSRLFTDHTKDKLKKEGNEKNWLAYYMELMFTGAYFLRITCNNCP